MGLPQWIWIGLQGVGLLIAAYEHGKTRKNTNFWSTLIAVTIANSILYWGGFFK